MRIALLSHNAIVTKLFELSIEGASYHADIVESAKGLEGHYDILFVDEGSVEDIERFGYQNFGAVVFIGKSPDSDFKYDHILLKPFLPSRIRTLIDTIAQEQKAGVKTQNEGGFLFPLQTPQEEEVVGGVLDKNELDRIKELLEEEDSLRADTQASDLSDAELERKKHEVIRATLEAEGLEIVDESAMVEDLDIAGKSDAEHIAEETVAILLNRFEAYVRSAKPKKIRKLLMGKKTKIKLP